MQAAPPAFAVAAGLRNTLGECPTWDAATGGFYWIDVMEKLLFRLDSSGAVRKWPLSDHPGSIAVRSQNEVLVAFRRGLSLFSTATGEETSLDCSGVDFAQERFNDGACDRRGRFWVGTLDRKLAHPVAGLYCFDGAGPPRKVLGGVTISNGIAWSPDSTRLYRTDSHTRRIHVHAFDLERGEVGEDRLFADFTAQNGAPDGCTVDAEGCLWSVDAHNARLIRFDPEGEVMCDLKAPTARPSSLAFGGPKLNTLYVTSMRHGLTPEQLAADPGAGSLFTARMDVHGLAEPRFAY